MMQRSSRRCGLARNVLNGPDRWLCALGAESKIVLRCGNQIAAKATSSIHLWFERIASINDTVGRVGSIKKFRSLQLYLGFEV
jgi:hypothetical protein